MILRFINTQSVTESKVMTSWIDVNDCHFQLLLNPNTTKSKLFIDSDLGITWNAYGKDRVEKEKDVGWVWCSPNDSLVKQRMRELSKKYLIVLFSTSPRLVSREILSEISKELGVPMIIINGRLSNIRETLHQAYPSVDDVCLERCLHDLPTVLLNTLNLTPADYYPDPKERLLILIGQGGCGKTTYSNHLREKGYTIVDSKTSHRIQRREPEEYNAWISLIHDSSISGVVIDANNHRESEQTFFRKEAETQNVSIRFLHISKPGLVGNSMQDAPCPRSMMFCYSKDLNIPSDCIRIG